METGSSPTRARIKFDVVNLLIRRELQCGPFLLKPVDGIDKAQQHLKRSGASPVITAIGTSPLPDPLPDGPWADLWQPVLVMERLLTFASRGHVQIVQPILEIETPDGWEVRGRHSYALQAGSARSSYLDVDELEGFLARCFPKLLDKAFTESSGLVLALAFYDQIFADRVAELQYLKAYLAFEVLYSRNVTTTTIQSPEAFTALRQKLEALLASEEEEGRLGADARGAITDKLVELNRLSAARACYGLCATTVTRRWSIRQAKATK
jgi:hypothetical protein